MSRQVWSIRSPRCAALSSASISSSLFTVRSFSSMSWRLMISSPGSRSSSRRYMLCGTQPSGSSGPARPSMPTLALVSFSSVRRSAMLSANVPFLRPHVGDPVLRAFPVFGEHRRIDEAGRLARQRKNQHVALGVAADRAEVARVGDVEVPHGRPAAQDEAIELARRHLGADRSPAAVALGERERRIFGELAHAGFLVGLCQTPSFFSDAR